MRITSRAVVSRRLPNVPPGWNRAKSLAWKWRISMRAQANASPIAKVAVVDEVGARFSGQASRLTFTFRWHVAYLASNESGLPEIPIKGI